MNDKINIARCASCGSTININRDTPQTKTPCEKCGGMKRIYEASITERVTMRDGIGIKGKRPGEKRPFIEDISRPDFSRKLQKHVHLKRVIDREGDRYVERVTDYESNEIIHECEEPLSEHQGHGRAAKKDNEK